MKKEDNVVFGCLGIILSVVLLVAVSTVINGWALVKLWGWFVLPVFESAPEINLVQAVGISMVVSLLTSKAVQESNKDGRNRSHTDRLP